MPSWVVMLTLCVSISAMSCHSPNPYLRDIHPDPTNPARDSIDREYLKALLADLDACYARKHP